MKPLEYLEASIDGKPITWARPVDRQGGTVRGRFTPEPYKSWKDKAAVTFQAEAKLRRFPAGAELAVAVDVYADRVEVRVSALDALDSRRPAGVTGDVDNYAKAVLDALQAAGTIADDRAVIDLRVRFRPHDPTKCSECGHDEVFHHETNGCRVPNGSRYCACPWTGRS